MEAPAARDSAPKLQETVYLLDPDEAIRGSVSSLLRAHDYRVEAFASGAALLMALQAERPGYLVMDLDLPDRCGFELLRQVASQYPEVAVIVTAGDADVPTAVRAMQAGAVDFVEKPFVGLALLQRIGRAGRQGRAAAPPGVSPDTWYPKPE